MCESCSPTVGLGAGEVDEGKTALDVGNAVMGVENGGGGVDDATFNSEPPGDDDTITLEVLCSTKLGVELEEERDNAADVVEDLEGEGDSDGDGDGNGDDDGDGEGVTYGSLSLLMLAQYMYTVVSWIAGRGTGMVPTRRTTCI